MAATVSVKELNGAAPGTANTITNQRYCTQDGYNPGTSDPLVKPSAGSNYSYWKSTYLNADTSPSGTIDNIKWYTDGTIGWTGCTLYVADEVPATYVQATGTQGTTGDEVVANHSGVTAVTDGATYTSAAPKSIAGSITNPNTGKITSGDLVTQVTLSTSAVAGTLAAETLTWRYDET